MIRVTRINDNELVINADLIEFVEAIPDTMISLTTGKKIIVRESPDEIIRRGAESTRLGPGGGPPPDGASLPLGEQHG
jgi:flagellar protein FlbD